MNILRIIAYIAGLTLSWLGIARLVRPLLRYINGKEIVYRISISGWLIAGIGTLILTICTGQYSTITIWLISFIGILIVKKKQDANHKSKED